MDDIASLTNLPNLQEFGANLTGEEEEETVKNGVGSVILG